MKFKTIAFAVFGWLLMPGLAFAVPVSLFNTGVDNSGNALPGGSTDTHFTVLETGTQAQVMNNIPVSYLPNSGSSMWIWENASGLPTGVTRTFRLTFDLSGLDHTTAQISGLWGSDDFGIDILINGQSTGNSLPFPFQTNFTSLHGFSITHGFQAGINTLDFIIQDTQTFNFVSGFRAELMGSAELQVSEASTAILLLLGLSFLLIGRLNRKP